MDNYEILPIQIQIDAARSELRSCNEFTAQYGLVLTESEIAELVTCRTEALHASDRVEFGRGILPKLIYAFCDSPYINRDNYGSTLAELQEAFYYFKTESMDRFSDDELIELMAKVFHGRAQGSAEYLIGTSLEALARHARDGFDPFDAEESGDLF